MRRTFVAALLTIVAAPALAQVEVQQPWARATVAGMKHGAGYMTIQNKGAAADRLVGATSPVAARVETHVTVEESGVMKMRQVKGYDVPARGSYELKPAGSHLMFVDLKQPLKAGDKVPVTLKFEKAGDVKIELQVAPGAPAAMKGHHHGH